MLKSESVFASLDLAAEPQLRLTELIAALTHNAVDFVVIGGALATVADYSTWLARHREQIF